MLEAILLKHFCRWSFVSVTYLYILPLVAVIALYQGHQRVRSLDIVVDDVLWISNWTSSGTSTEFEVIPMPSPGMFGQEIAVRALLGDKDWISITEVGALNIYSLQVHQIRWCNEVDILENAAFSTSRCYQLNTGVSEITSDDVDKAHMYSFGDEHDQIH